VLCEVQQHSDITYRVFDYNRVGLDGKPRSLHVRQALNVMRFGEQSGGRLRPGSHHARSSHGNFFSPRASILPPSDGNSASESLP